MNMIKHYTKYIETLGADKDILETYRNLRQSFQREGWSEKGLVVYIQNYSKN